MLALPTHISVASARLPATYEQAKTSLANCASIDECQEWANKAEALAAYARMADDDALRKLADRIQGRAVRRAGELLKQFDGRGRPKENTDGASSILSQRAIADRAGMSEHQQVQASRVANIPAADFEREIESESPPSVTNLAEMGTKKRETPPGFREATAALGNVERFARFCGEHDGEEVGIHRDQMDDAELDAKADAYEVMGAACYAHAKEIRRYKKLRQIAAE